MSFCVSRGVLPALNPDGDREPLRFGLSHALFVTRFDFGFQWHRLRIAIRTVRVIDEIHHKASR